MIPYFRKFRCKKDGIWRDYKNNDLSEIEPLLTKILRIYEKQNAKNIIIRYVGSDEEIDRKYSNNILFLKAIKNDIAEYALNHHNINLPIPLLNSYFEKIPKYINLNYIMVL